MKYNPIHNILMRDANDTDDVIEDGGRVRVPMTLMDSMQRAIAADSGTIDDGDVELISRQEIADWDKAQLSARWKGGLQDGDRVRIGDRDLVVSGRNPTTGKIQLSDASTQDGNALKQQAYDSYDNDIQSRYLNTHDAVAGGACTTAGREAGTWREREKDGRLVCVSGGKPDEWDIAGPLSDEQRVKVMDEAYQNYDDQVSNAWRR